MPYLKASRSGAASTTVYIPWAQAMETGLRRLAREALSEPGTATVELMDDCRSRIMIKKKRPATLATEVEAEARERAAEHLDIAHLTKDVTEHVMESAG